MSREQEGGALERDFQNVTQLLIKWNTNKPNSLGVKIKTNNVPPKLLSVLAYPA